MGLAVEAIRFKAEFAVPIGEQRSQAPSMGNGLRMFRGDTKAGEAELTCPHANGCAMFDLLKMAGTLRTWQIRYCGGEFEACARFKTSALGRNVPANLMPNGQYLRFSGAIKPGR